MQTQGSQALIASTDVLVDIQGLFILTNIATLFDVRKSSPPPLSWTRKEPCRLNQGASYRENEVPDSERMKIDVNVVYLERKEGAEHHGTTRPPASPPPNQYIYVNLIVFFL